MMNPKENGVLFGEKHSFRDYGLIMTNKNITDAVAQTRFVSVPGRNGSIDLSEVVTGNVRYDDRKITLEFYAPITLENLDAYISDLRNELSGEKVRLVFDDDIAFYWSARITNVGLKVSGGERTISIEAYADPYKYTIQSTEEDWLWNPFDFEQSVINDFGNIVVEGTKTITIEGVKKYTTPTITCSAPMTVTFNGRTYNLAQGSQIAYGILLTEGTDTLTFNGNGVVSINYVGGSL